MKYIIDVPEDRIHDGVLCAMGIMEDSLSHYIPTGIKAVPYDESEAEKRGQEEAWELIKTIGKMSDQEMRECFGEEIIVNLSYDEARVKYEIWKMRKDKEKLHVGDEVNVYDGKAVLLDKIVDGWFVMNENGTVETFRNKEISGKTGRHFPEVAELLKKLREPS